MRAKYIEKSLQEAVEEERGQGRGEVEGGVARN